MSNKNTKRALLISVMACVLCLSMFVGSTFAWFTDSVTSSGNVIKSGTLRVGMYWADGTEDPATATYADAEKEAIFNYDNWEPGYTEVRHVKIANEGTLALKYLVDIKANGEVSALADVIDVYFVDPAVQVADRSALVPDYKVGTLTEVLAGVATMTYGELTAGNDVTVTIALAMQTSAGNEYQDMAIGSDFSVKVFATQLAYEDDDFGPDYDAGAYLPVVNTAEELAGATADGMDVTMGNDVAVDEMIDVIEGYTAGVLMTAGSLNGNGNTLDMIATTVNWAGIWACEDATAITNLTLNTTAKTAIYVQDTNDGFLLENVTASTTVGNALHVENVDAIVLKNNNLTAGTGAMYDAAIFAGVGSNVIVESGKYVGNIVTGGSAKSTITINGGTFTGNIQVNGSDQLIINGGTFSVDPSAYVNGADVVYNGDGTWTVKPFAISSATELATAVADGAKNVELAAGNYTFPAGVSEEITISGTEDAVITIAKPNLAGSDVTLNGVTVKGSGYSTGIQHVSTVTYNDVTIIGEMCLYGEKVVFNNCTFELNNQYVWVYDADVAEFNNCVFNTNGKAILIYNEGAGASNVTVNGCTFNATAGAKAGAIANQNCAAIEIDNFQTSGTGIGHSLTTMNNTYSENFSGEWRIKKYVAGNAITVNGVEYTSIAVDGKLMTIDASKNVTVL